jgi:hypothetical protein
VPGCSRSVTGSSASVRSCQDPPRPRCCRMLAVSSGRPAPSVGGTRRSTELHLADTLKSGPGAAGRFQRPPVSAPALKLCGGLTPHLPPFPPASPACNRPRAPHLLRVRAVSCGWQASASPYSLAPGKGDAKVWRGLAGLEVKSDGVVLAVPSAAQTLTNLAASCVSVGYIHRKRFVKARIGVGLQAPPPGGGSHNVGSASADAPSPDDPPDELGSADNGEAYRMATCVGGASGHRDESGPDAKVYLNAAVSLVGRSAIETHASVRKLAADNVCVAPNCGPPSCKHLHPHAPARGCLEGKRRVAEDARRVLSGALQKHGGGLWKYTASQST